MADSRTMVKKVNVVARIPVRNVYPPLHGEYKGISMSPSNILKCILGRATVDEILSDGSTLRLNARNYNTDNTPKKYKEPKLDELQPAVGPAVGNNIQTIIVSDTVGVTEETIEIVDNSDEVKTEEITTEEPSEVIEETTEVTDEDNVATEEEDETTKATYNGDNNKYRQQYNNKKHRR